MPSGATAYTPNNRGSAIVAPVKAQINCLNLTAAPKLSVLFAPREGQGLPMEFGPILKWGRNPSTRGDVILGEKTRSLFDAMQRRLGFEEVALDFEHNTVEGTPAWKESKEPRPVAAYGAYQLRPEGLFFKVNRWTPIGEKEALNFADLSPAVKQDAEGEVIFGHSLALVRQGSVFGVHAFSVDVADGKTEEETIMDKVLELLRKSLGLKVDAAEQEIVDALKGVVGMSARLATAEGTITTLSASLKTAETGLAQIATLQASIAKAEKSLACYQARIEGKLIPFSAEAIDKMELKDLVDALGKLEPGKVPLTTLSAGAQDHAGSGRGLTEQDIKLGRELGYTEEQIKAANGIK